MSVKDSQADHLLALLKGNGELSICFPVFLLELGNVLMCGTDVDQKISEFASIKSQVKHQHVQVCLILTSSSSKFRG